MLDWFDNSSCYLQSKYRYDVWDHSTYTILEFCNIIFFWIDKKGFEFYRSLYRGVRTHDCNDHWEMKSWKSIYDGHDRVRKSVPNGNNVSNTYYVGIGR